MNNLRNVFYVCYSTLFCVLFIRAYVNRPQKRQISAQNTDKLQYADKKKTADKGQFLGIIRIRG